MPRRRLTLIGLLAIVAIAAGVGLVLTRHAVLQAVEGPPLTAAPPSPETRSPSATNQPPGSLQALVDAAPSGAVVHVPAGLYRETVDITKPLTLIGDGAMIRGSDVFTAWSTIPAGWRSAAAMPSLALGGTCLTVGCDRPEQVHLDGRPLSRTDGQPGAGQFALDAQRHVLLGADPAGHIVEVTVRSAWIVVRSSDVTVEDFVMDDAGSPAQHGGVDVADSSHVTLDDLTLEGAHGADLTISGGQDVHVSDSDIGGAGQLGLRVEGSTDVTVTDVVLHGNNTAGFDPGWEAGGMKALDVSGLQITDNRSYGNDGAGFWCDEGCSGVTFSGNRAYDNSGAGIMFEISSGATITGNVVYENGWGSTSWGWGAGILISSSAAVTVSGNTVAWNADGISVISQDRNKASADDVHGVAVRGNTIIMAPQPGDHSDVMALAWLQDWGGVLFASGSANSGSGNAYWWPGAVPHCGYGWNGCYSSLSAFNATPGDQGGAALSSSTKAARLAAAGIPAAPQHH